MHRTTSNEQMDEKIERVRSAEDIKPLSKFTLNNRIFISEFTIFLTTVQDFDRKYKVTTENNVHLHIPLTSIVHQDHQELILPYMVLWPSIRANMEFVTLYRTQYQIHVLLPLSYTLNLTCCDYLFNGI